MKLSALLSLNAALAYPTTSGGDAVAAPMKATEGKSFILCVLVDYWWILKTMQTLKCEIVCVDFLRAHFFSFSIFSGVTLRNRNNLVES